MVTFNRYDDVVAVLSDARFEVPPAPAAGPNIDMVWFRASVPRFSNGDVHERRRAYAVAALDEIDPGELRAKAAALVPSTDRSEIAVRVLAEALGVTVCVDDVLAVASEYLDGGNSAGASVLRLVEAFGGSADEVTAARISLLVQACTATAKLIELRLARSALPPVPLMRRVCVDAAMVGAVAVEPGEPVALDLVPAAMDGKDLMFGAGMRPCPGRDHAIAIADGVVEDALRTSTPTE